MLLYQTLSLIYQESESAGFSREEPEGKYFKVCGPDYFCRWLHSFTAVEERETKRNGWVWAKPDLSICWHQSLSLRLFSMS